MFNYFLNKSFKKGKENEGIFVLVIVCTILVWDSKKTREVP